MLSLESQTLRCAKATIISAYSLQLKMSSCNKRNTNVLLKNYNLSIVITAYVKSVGGTAAKVQTRYQNLHVYVHRQIVGFS